MTTFLPAVLGDTMMDVLDTLNSAWMKPLDSDRNAFSFGSRMMRTDVQETEDGYALSMEMPGMSKDDIHLDLENGQLTVSAQKTEEKEESGEKGKFLRRERYTGSMRRSFYVGKNVTEEDIRASYENGVLKVTVPKKEAQPLPEKKTIRIEG